MIPELDISVVIASIGRDSLWPLLEQIEKDLTDLRFEVIVVLDNPNYVVDERTRQKFSSTKFITIKDKLGAAAAYQLGIEVSQGNFFRIFADDDIWILGSTQELLKLTEINSIIIGEVLLQDEIGQIKRSSPKKINQSGIVGSVYQTIIPWRRNPNYLTLTSMIFPEKAKYIKMDSRFSTKEDIIWLQGLWAQGFIFRDAPFLTSIVNVSLDRTLQRNSLMQEKYFVEYLATFDKKIAANYLFQHSGRAAAAIGKINYFVRIFKIAGTLKLYPSLVNTFVNLILIFICFATKLKIELYSFFCKK